LPAALAIGIFVFIARFGMAHDESRCPFREVETRRVATGLEVREEARRCLPEVEEHRWLVLREGGEPRELGRYPRRTAQPGQGLPWRARERDGRVIVTVTNVGRGDIVFREPPPDHRELYKSYTLSDAHR
jgi:hypothetical protein